ncbi:hypothetical protein N8913_04155 [Litoricola sp.]|nr:hypothetical protein [Litorivicinus sp.]
MFSVEDTIQDDRLDEVGRLVKAIQQIPTMTNEKRVLVAELQNLANSHGYITFSAGNHRWHVGKVGESYLYQVPENKLGHLAQFRGKLVRVVCIGSGTRWIRAYMAGPVWG